MIELGKKYRDIVSGFTGIATAEHRYLNGCVQATLTAVAEKGKEPVLLSFDVEQLKEVGKGIVKPKSKPSGGPADERVALPRR